MDMKNQKKMERVLNDAIWSTETYLDSFEREEGYEPQNALLAATLSGVAFSRFMAEKGVLASIPQLFRIFLVGLRYRKDLWPKGTI